MTTLDRITDDILDLLGKPAHAVHGNGEDSWLAMYSQGKRRLTPLFAVKPIILLKGTLETLRRQTQERLDEGFVGRTTPENLPSYATTVVLAVSGY